MVAIMPIHSLRIEVIASEKVLAKKRSGDVRGV